MEKLCKSLAGISISALASLPNRPEGGFKIFLMGYGMHLCLFFKTYHRRYLTDISTTAKLFVITAKEAIQLPNYTFGT